MPMTEILARLYALAVHIRVYCYRKGILKARALDHPVISVGNLTVGGTGKTPWVAYLAEMLKKSGYQPVILSRGYRGKAEHSTLLVSNGRQILCEPEECGDEPYWLAQKLKGVPLAVGKNRYRAARQIQGPGERTVFVLDDGFQHLALKRDLNILIIDATDPFGGFRLLPRGRLREPLKAIERADLVVVTRSHYPFDQDEIELQVRERNAEAPLTYFYHDATGLYDLKSGRSFTPRDFMGKRVIALAAIGNPGIFLRDLAHYQIRVVTEFLFRDHHCFTQSEIDSVLGKCAELGTDGVVTTEKDAVRLQKLEFADNRIFALQIEVRAEDDEGARKLLLEATEAALARRRVRA